MKIFVFDSDPIIRQLDELAPSGRHQVVNSYRPTPPIDLYMIAAERSEDVARVVNDHPLVPVVTTSRSPSWSPLPGVWRHFCWSSSTFELLFLWEAAKAERARRLSGQSDPMPDELVRERCLRELARNQGNVSAAAAAVGMHRTTFGKKLRGPQMSKKSTN